MADSSHSPIKEATMRAKFLLTTVAVVIGIVTSGVAFDASAQQSGAMTNGQMAMPAQASGTEAASTRAFQENAASMMKGMSGPGYTGDADADFVAHMIPHHQGAVDQAQVELQYGKDPDMRALAKRIIKAQNEEIAYMKQWQSRHNKSAEK
jgi:uncharacterized protein (DUF305 family)